MHNRIADFTSYTLIPGQQVWRQNIRPHSHRSAAFSLQCSVPLVFVWITALCFRLPLDWVFLVRFLKNHQNMGTLRHGQTTVWQCVQGLSVMASYRSQKKWHSMYLSEKAHSRGHTCQNTCGFLPRKQRWSVQPAC